MPSMRLPHVFTLLTLLGSLAACDRGSKTGQTLASNSATTSQPESVDSLGNPVFLQRDTPPEVSLSGASSAQHLSLPGSSNRLAALAWETPIYKLPDKDSVLLGYLRVGAIVAASAKPVGYKDCPAGWYQIAPFGHVCIAPSNATLDLQHELVRATAQRPDVTNPLPYIYGIVRKPGPIYSKLPSLQEASSAESDLGSRMAEWLELSGPNGASFRTDLWLRWKDPTQVPTPQSLWESKANLHIPWFLDGRSPPGNLANLGKNKNDLVVGQMRKHQGFAFIDTAVRDGRRYGITTRLLSIPVDRVRPIAGSSFHGFEIPSDIDFPFALVRARNAFAYRIDNGKRTKANPLAHRSAIALVDKKTFHGGVLHYQTADGFWVSDREVSRLDPARRMPAWGKNGERWIDINITKQTLVAYDGTKPVFATLVSTGEAGLGDPEKSKSTKRGIFRIDRKHLTATMSSSEVGEEFELNDIPFAQYFEGGYALHAAYWHDDFGVPKSHGCINLSPDDARRLFFWTEPRIPPDWHSVQRSLTGSVVFVHP